METSRNNSIEYKKIPVIFYPGYISYRLHLASNTRDILDIILKLMNFENVIYLDEKTLSNIQNAISSSIRKDFSHIEIQNGINELIKYDILLSYYGLNYMVNPYQYMKKSREVKRRKLLKAYGNKKILNEAIRFYSRDTN